MSHIKGLSLIMLIPPSRIIPHNIPIQYDEITSDERLLGSINIMPSTNVYSVKNFVNSAVVKYKNEVPCISLREEIVPGNAL